MSCITIKIFPLDAADRAAERWAGIGIGPADIQIWDTPTLEEMVYRLGHNPVRTVIKRGKVVYG